MTTLVFIGMAVPTAGATTPIEASPGFYRFLAEFEPLRQITGGIRSILYYDAQGDAGLTRVWAMMAAGRTVRLRRTGVVRPQGTAPHPGGDEAREDRRPGVTAGHPRGHYSD